MTIKTDYIQVGLDATGLNNFTLRPESSGLVISNGVPFALGQDYVRLASNTITLTPQVIFNSSITESALINTQPPGATQTYGPDKSIVFHTANTTNNFTMNFTGFTGLATGVSESFAVLVTNGNTAYFSNTIQVDGTTTGVTTRWQSSVPSSGNSNKVDVYNVSIIKTSSNTYSVFAAQTNFG